MTLQHKWGGTKKFKKKKKNPPKEGWPGLPRGFHGKFHEEKRFTRGDP